MCCFPTAELEEKARHHNICDLDDAFYADRRSAARLRAQGRGKVGHQTCPGALAPRVRLDRKSQRRVVQAGEQFGNPRVAQILQEFVRVPQDVLASVEDRRRFSCRYSWNLRFLRYTLRALLPAIVSSFAGKDCGCYFRPARVCGRRIIKDGRFRGNSANGWAERPSQPGISHLQQLSAPATRGAIPAHPSG